MDYSSTYKLAQDIRESEEYKTYHELKDSVMDDETTAALIREYRKLQMVLQMSAISGQNADTEAMQRFSGLSTLLFSKKEVSDFKNTVLHLYKEHIESLTQLPEEKPAEPAPAEEPGVEEAPVPETVEAGEPTQVFDPVEKYTDEVETAYIDSPTEIISDMNDEAGEDKFKNISSLFEG